MIFRKLWNRIMAHAASTRRQAAASLGLAAVTAATVVTMALAPGLDAQASVLPATSYTQIAGTMLYVSPESSQAYTSQLATYQLIPYDILVSLVQKDCRIYLATSSESGGYLDGEAYGLYNNGSFAALASDMRQITRIITPNSIDVLSDYDTAFSGLVLLHEVGHFIDDNAWGGWSTHARREIASTMPQWQTIYAKDAAALGTLSDIAAICTYSADQCFATTFAHYLLTPAQLQAASPDAYAYMAAVVASFAQ